MKTVVIERDIDEDRFITYEQFKQIINYFPALNKWQIYFMLSGVLGWRPIEIARINLNDIDFEGKRMKRKIAKPKRNLKQYKEKVYEVQHQKIKWSDVPGWAFAMLTMYIRHNFQTMANGWIFPSPDSLGKHIDSKSARDYIYKLRNRLYKEDPKKWSWVKDTFQTIIYPNGKKQFYYKVSLYSFRKMHVSYYAQMLLDKGFTDVVLHTSKHIGHTNPKTTLRYLKSLVDEKPIVNAGFRKAVSYGIDFVENRPKVTKDQKRLIDF